MTHMNDEVLQAYLAGELSIQKEIEIMEHIAVCDSCAKRFADGMTEKNMVTPPPDLKSGILEQTVYRKSTVRTIQELQERKRAKQKELMGYAVKVGLAMAASILMVISISSNGSIRQSEWGIKQQETVVETPKGPLQKEARKRNRISGSLQKASGKMGDALTGFLDIFEREKEEERD